MSNKTESSVVIKERHNEFVEQVVMYAENGDFRWGDILNGLAIIAAQMLVNYNYRAEGVDSAALEESTRRFKLALDQTLLQCVEMAKEDAQ